MKSRGLILLLLAGLGIAAVSFWRERQLARWRSEAASQPNIPRQLAPRFELADQHRHIVKFERFLGRQKVLLLLLDGETKPLEDSRLRQVWDGFDAIRRTGVEVVVVGADTATPYVIQAAEKELGRKAPFPVLADIMLRHPQRNPVHHLWGCVDPRTGAPRKGMFLIARDGKVPVDADGLPVPVEDEQHVLAELCAGRVTW